MILFESFAFSYTAGINDTLDTNTVLYKVTHSDIDNVSYLFGTHHAFGKPFFDSLKPANDALISSDILIKENLNIPGHLAEDIINKRTSTTNWRKYLDEDNHQYILNLFSSSNLEFDRMTPAELYAFLSRHYKEKIYIGKDSNAGYFSLDDYLAYVAEQNRVDVVGLETTEEQINLINDDIRGMPVKVHKKRLSRMIARIKSETHDLCGEIEWYRSMQFDFKMNQPCSNDLILTGRNDKWMVQINEYLKLTIALSRLD